MMNSTIDSIRNILRNEGITGFESIKHCIVFTLNRYLDEELCNELNIPIEFTFENTLKVAKLKKKSKLQELYLKDDGFIVQLATNLNYLIDFKVNVPLNLSTIIEKLNNIKVDKLNNEFDIIGTIYELHLRTGTSNAMRDLGQYFTHRLVIKYMIKLAKPTPDNIVIDPTCGTGGFLTMTAKYLNDRHNIDWSTQKDNLYGFDLDENVQNMCALNLLLETGFQFDNIYQRDTLYKDMKISDNAVPLTADVILANEPMGLKNLQHANCCDRIKDLKIRGTKCEPLFLQEFMQALNDNGRCVVIVPDGVLTNESALHKGTRKHLIENFKLLKVISLNDKDFFMNTGVSASILFFKKNGSKTKKVKFLEIKLKDGGIEETPIVQASYDDIKSKGYSLFVNKYKPKNGIRFDGVEYKKLGDICTFLPKSKRQASFGSDNGEYPFYTSGSKIKYCDECDYNEYTIIIGDGGIANIHFDKKFCCSDHHHLIQSQIDQVLDKYIHYYLLINIDILEEGFKGSTLKNLSKTYIQEIEIPIPSLEIQKMIVERLDTLSENNKGCRKLIQNTKQIMKYYVEAQTIHEPKKKLKDIAYLDRQNMKKDEYDFINYIDIGSVQEGRLLNIQRLTEDYPSRAQRKVSKDSILLSTVRPNLKNYTYINTDIEHCIASTGFVVIETKSTGTLLNKYLYYYIQSDNITDYLTTNGKGTNYPSVNKSDIEIMDIIVPPLSKQQEIVQYCDTLQTNIDAMEKQITNNDTLMETILETFLR